MSQENVEIISRLYDEFLAKPERVASPEQLAFFDPAVEIHQSDSLLGSKGTTATTAWKDFVPKRITEVGDRVMATVEFRGIGKEGGVRVAPTVGHVWTLKGGRIIAWHVYFDPAEALEAAGLSE